MFVFLLIPQGCPDNGVCGVKALAEQRGRIKKINYTVEHGSSWRFGRKQKRLFFSFGLFLRTMTIYDGPGADGSCCFLLLSLSFWRFGVWGS